MSYSIFVLYDILGKTYVQKNEATALETQNRAYQQQICLMEQSKKQIRYLKHDMRNHLIRISELAKENDMYAILDYTHNAGKFMEPVEAYVQSGNHDIDSILNMKLAEAVGIGTQHTAAVTVPEQLTVSAFDMTIILGNLLDNAIAALSICEPKRLRIQMNYQSGVLYIRMRNTFCPNQRQAPGEHKGLGLENIRKIVEKYDGELRITKTQTIYEVNLLLLCAEKDGFQQKLV